MQVVAMRHAEPGAVHTKIEIVIVNVYLPTEKSLPIAPEVRAFLEALPGGDTVSR